MPKLDLLEGEAEPAQAPTEKRLKHWRVKDLLAWEPPVDMVLVGQRAILRGSEFAIAGAPGVGKSRAASWLAIRGALGRSWMGEDVHQGFRTMILQNENGRFRLWDDARAMREIFTDHEIDILQERVDIIEPPAMGLQFTSPEFCQEVAEDIAIFKPDVVIIDPWNAVAHDDGQRDYQEAFMRLKSVLPAGDDKPALGIVCHTRKPKAGEQAKGTDGLHELAGSHVLTSVPRCIWRMSRASNDAGDSGVILENVKNNNGPLSPRSAWERGAVAFDRIADFDWKEFDSSGKTGNAPKITAQSFSEAFGHEAILSKKELAQKLVEASACSQSYAYKAIDGDRFGMLEEVPGGYRLKAGGDSSSPVPPGK